MLSKDVVKKAIKADTHPVIARDLQKGYVLDGLWAVFMDILLLEKWILTVCLQRCRMEPLEGDLESLTIPFPFIIWHGDFQAS